MNRESKILVTGHRGLVGSALVRLLESRGHTNVVTVGRETVDLTNPVEVQWYFSVTQPEYVFHCAAKVGGLGANRRDPLGFFLDNMAIQVNVLANAAKYNVKKMLFLGSSCIYPSDARKPLEETSLLTGPFEPDVEPYGLAKATGVRLCQWYRKQRGCNFVAALPCNIYGKQDTLCVDKAHVVPGLLLRMTETRTRKAPFSVWGDGTARRELLYSDDLAEALYLVMERYDDVEPINTGSGLEVTIRELAEQCARVVGRTGGLVYDAAEPVGAQEKLLDNTKLFSLGWRPTTSLTAGLRQTWDDLRVRRRNARAYARAKENPEKAREAKRKYLESEKGAETSKAHNFKAYWEHREAELARHRLAKYGITVAAYQSLLSQQKGLCAICESAMKSPEVDHCHKTGRIRGLLCGPCNKFLGLAKDSISRLERAVKYLTPG